MAVYAVVRQGAELAAKVTRGLDSAGGAALFLPCRLEERFGPEACYFEASREAIANNFRRFSGHVVIGATGLTVRHIAPLLLSKKEDPAVVALTQDGRFAVSLLSGHLGGGNDLTLKVADICGGQAVISTATDIEGLPALEMVARDQGLVIEDFRRLPLISRMLVEGKRIRIHDPESYLGEALAPWADCFEFTGKAPAAGPQVRVSFRLEEQAPPETLIMRPKTVALALGCHRGIDRSEVDEFIDRTLKEENISLKSVALMATLESRAEEPAFLAVSRDRGWPLVIFTKDELSLVEVPNPSGKVMERIGVASVCEAAAMLAAKTDRLLISKRKSARATLAAALLNRKP